MRWFRLQLRCAIGASLCLSCLTERESSANADDQMLRPPVWTVPVPIREDDPIFPTLDAHRTKIEADLAKRLEKSEPEPKMRAQARTCAACQTANDADAKFCKGCGHRL